MSPMETDRLILTANTPEDARAMIDALAPEDRAQVSADWLAMLDTAAGPDPWMLGFTVSLRSTGEAIGSCGFKGPPTADGVVEIAYAIEALHRGKGYATETAAAVTAFAFDQPGVERVRAHTLRESNASTRVLTKCGFRRVGEVIDPEDGPVWRWEKVRGE